FLALLTLELDPVRTAPGDVRPLRPLADQAFATRLASLRQQRMHVPRQVPAEANASPSLAEQRAQLLLALVQRLAPKIPAVIKQQVENEVRQMRLCRTATAFHRVLQALEIGA